jgi:hypothetical protein
MTSRSGYTISYLSNITIFIVCLGITGCGSSHHSSSPRPGTTAMARTSLASASPSPTPVTPTASADSSPSPSTSSPNSSPKSDKPTKPESLIANTAANKAVCRQFAAEQSGELTPKQFNVWLLQNGNSASNQLIQSLANWFISINMNPGESEGYAGQVFAECSSIGLLT